MLLTDILDAAGVDVHTRDGDEISICCPFPDCGDTRFRLGINVRDGRAHCFNCDWKGNTVIYTGRQLAKAYGLKFHSKMAVQERKNKPAPKPIDEPLTVLPDYYETFRRQDEIGDKALAYLKSRGVSTLQIVRHQIGYSAVGPMAWRVLFPVMDLRKNILGIVGRDFSGKQTPKYRNTEGVKHLWNGGRIASTAIVVEGVMDALRVEQALLQRTGYQAVARLGSVITSNQLDQLKEFDRAVTLPDFDRAGVLGAIELCDRCYARGIQVSVVIPDEMSGRDPGDMTEEEILDCLSSAVPWGEYTDKRLRLAASRETVFDD